MPRINLTVPETMLDTLRQVSEDTGVPIAVIFRQAIEEWSQKRNIKIKDTISWGGPRDRAKETGESQGQRVPEFARMWRTQADGPVCIPARRF